MAQNPLIHLSRRQRQIMDILFRQDECSAEEIRSALPDAPSNSAVRAMLATLKDKGHIKHREKNLRYVYSATMGKDTAQQTAVDRLINTFFGGSTVEAMSAMLGMQTDKISAEELEALSHLIEKAKEEGM